MKTVLITGASGNLGKAVCKQFLSDGYQVIAIIGQNNPLEDLFQSKHLDIHSVDLRSEMEVNQLSDELCARYKKIDVAVFLAGGFAAGNIKNSGKQQMDDMYKLNFETAYFFSRQLFLHMEKNNGGYMFFVGSRPAIDAASAVSMLPYALSKSLVIKLAEIYNAAGKKKNIIAHVLIPSVIDTPENRKSNPKADFTKWVAPEKIAQSILFACSEPGSVIREGVFKLYGDS